METNAENKTKNKPPGMCIKTKIDHQQFSEKKNQITC